MANTKEIQKRMKSIRDTMKITSAMYMISSAKLRSAKQKLEQTEPYFYTLQSAIARFLRHMPETTNSYFDQREQIPDNEKKRGYIVITADKGLAGAYNHNVIKMAPELFSQGQWQLLSIARAAAARPKLLLLDEITANLDAETEKEVLEALKRVSENRTVISISHRVSAKMGRIIPIEQKL